jgi:hypothetical protein
MAADSCDRWARLALRGEYEAGADQLAKKIRLRCKASGRDPNVVGRELTIRMEGSDHGRSALEVLDEVAPPGRPGWAKGIPDAEDAVDPAPAAAWRRTRKK